MNQDKYLDEVQLHRRRDGGGSPRSEICFFTKLPSAVSNVEVDQSVNLDWKYSTNWNIISPTAVEHWSCFYISLWGQASISWMSLNFFFPTILVFFSPPQIMVSFDQTLWVGSAPRHSADLLPWCCWCLHWVAAPAWVFWEHAGASKEREKDEDKSGVVSCEGEEEQYERREWVQERGEGEEDGGRWRASRHIRCCWEVEGQMQRLIYVK